MARAARRVGGMVVLRPLTVRRFGWVSLHAFHCDSIEVAPVDERFFRCVDRRHDAADKPQASRDR
ncbi:hypothetical protein [Parvularcula dongshanensis]|uniref:hypothetical protein n=1 Tax=Parvularcula dongshanensis TaxID=1173995 RepID=UPI00160B631A|nr:hypothetical protein [Parvularcula dongshanensis]